MKGILGKLYADKTPKERDSIKRQVFLAGTFFYTSQPLEGLEELPYILEQNEDDVVTILSSKTFSAPDILAQDQPNIKVEQDVAIDYRCSNCTNSFVDWNGLVMHCQATGHTPVYGTDVPSPSAPIQVFEQYINLALNRAMRERFAPWGKAFVDPRTFATPENRHDQKLGVNVFTAYKAEFTVGRPSAMDRKAQIMLTVDIGAKLIRTSSLLHNLFNNREPQPNYNFSLEQQVDAESRFIGEVVISKLDKKCYFVHSLVWTHSPDTLMVDGLNISHTQYVCERKNYDLEYPDVCLMVAVNGRNNSIIHLPPEIVCVNELDDDLRAQLPMIASFNPEKRNDSIEVVRKFLTPGAQKTKNKKGLLPALGIVLDDERITIPAEVLPAPVLCAAGITIGIHQTGNWSRPLERANFRVEANRAVQLNVIVIFHRQISWEEPYRKIAQFVNQCSLNYRFPEQPYRVIRADNDMEQHWGAVEHHFQEGAELPDNVFVIDMTKPRTATDRAYPIVKKMFASGGILSQFVNFRNLNHNNLRGDKDQRRSSMILSAVARQILNKSGVAIWWTSVPRGLPLPAVYIGVDVSHAPKQYDPVSKRFAQAPSVAAIVVKVITEEGAKIQCYSQTYLRQAGNEYDLGESVEETLTNMKRILQVDPKSCLYWRDGVPDSAMKNTCNQEVPAIRRVLGPNCPIAMLVCQKRISTKFLYQKDGKTHGMPAGLLVEGISDRNYQTFYLNGTSPPFSTAKPVRFLVALNELPQEVSLPAATWAEAHVYPNWSGPIKSPAVTQMAHVLADYASKFEDHGTSIDHAKFANHLYFL